MKLPTIFIFVLIMLFWVGIWGTIESIIKMLNPSSNQRTFIYIVLAISSGTVLYFLDLIKYLIVT